METTKKQARYLETPRSLTSAIAAHYFGRGNIGRIQYSGRH